MNLRRSTILREMGLTPLWRLRTSTGAVDTDTSVGALGATPVHLPAEKPDAPASALHTTPHHQPVDFSCIATMDWPQLEEAIHACRACTLFEARTQAVPGVGDRQARWMFVGEGPGVEEDRRGEPFVGQAGRLLDHMLAALGLKRGEDVYIANAVKCRPPHNRTPQAAEIAACAAYLDRQIALVRPRLLIALGRPAAQALLGREISIAAARGKRFERDGAPLIVTYHPAYLLRNPQDKGKAWEDLCLARRLVTEAAQGEA
ncbi:MAG: uracil-DNA glycosylase [Betaproteobacteria bacterium]|nr:uracil-DNA glycosylase [Betaproteobacteria bacterium]